jgi:hypothetical protein
MLVRVCAWANDLRDVINDVYVVVYGLAAWRRELELRLKRLWLLVKNSSRLTRRSVVSGIGF